MLKDHAVEQGLDNFHNEFRNARKAAERACNALPAGAEQDSARASLNSYGAERTVNGVTVGQGKLANGVAAEARTAYFAYDEKAGTFIAQVEVVLNEGGSGNLSVDVAHEGRHVADAQGFAGALTQDVAMNGAQSTAAIMGEFNRTRYEREVRAYTVSSSIAQGLGLPNLSVRILKSGTAAGDKLTAQPCAPEQWTRT